ncbi:hypothetical protein BOX15_Mlig009883g1, partial [Macrostomum lignano]
RFSSVLFASQKAEVAGSQSLSLMMKPSSVKPAKEVAQVYSNLAAYPVPQSAQLLPQYPFSDAIRTRCVYQVQDLASQKNRTLVKTAVVLPTGDLVDSDPVLRDPTTLWDVYCSGGDHRAVLLKLKAEGSGSDNADKFVVHVYNESRFIKSIDLSEKAKHGAVYGPELGACQWSCNEGHLLYVAEKKQPKNASYFAADAFSEESAGKPGEAKSVGKQYDSVEHFGEQLSEYKRPVLCTLDVDSEVVTVLDDGIPDGVLPTEPCWAPDDAGVVFVGYKELPYQLGVIYCNQRPSAIYYLDFRSGECAVIGHDTRAVSSPRFSPCQTQLVWLQNEPSGPHKQCRRLIWCDWATKDIRFIIDFVNQAGSAGFPGIYADSLPSRCWSSNCRTVVLSSINRSKDCLLAIDVKTKIGELLPLPPDASSAKVLDFHRDWLVVEASAPNVPPFIAAGFIDASKPLTSNIKWTCLTDCFKLNDIAWRVKQHTAKLAHPEFGNQLFESILVWPVGSSKKKDSKKGDEEKPAAITELPLPLIAFPHGGPNTSFTATYMRYVCGLARCGYAVLVINYRGSLGFGKSTVDSLLGGIGERDVSDCIQAVEETLAESASSADNSALPRLDGEKLAAFGGSHGGFLGGHLIGQRPGMFKAAVLRNPVINLATMVGGSDIPDWVYEQSGLPFSHDRLLDAETLALLWSKSPLSHASKVNTPTLVAVGLKDLRVPPQQGRELYRALRARNVPTRLLVCPDDCHPMSSVPVQSSVFVDIVLWFNRHVMGVTEEA